MMAYRWPIEVGGGVGRARRRGARAGGGGAGTWSSRTPCFPRGGPAPRASSGRPRRTCRERRGHGAPFIDLEVDERQKFSLHVLKVSEAVYHGLPLRMGALGRASTYLLEAVSALERGRDPPELWRRGSGGAGGEGAGRASARAGALAPPNATLAGRCRTSSSSGSSRSPRSRSRTRRRPPLHSPRSCTTSSSSWGWLRSWPRSRTSAGTHVPSP